MADFFKTEHNLQLRGWYIKTPEGVGKTLFPEEVQVDPALLPAADAPMAEAIRTIMTDSRISGSMKMKYQQAWRANRGAGGSAAAAPVAKAPATLKRLIEEKGEHELGSRKRILLEDIDLTTADGQELVNAPVILRLPAEDSSSTA